MPRNPSTISPLHRLNHRPRKGTDWRCAECGALLGCVLNRQLHVRFGRRHEYVTALPASCTCVACGGLNRVAAVNPR